MKNFKKVLALVLAVATLLSFATVASAARKTTASYNDATSVSYKEAVDVLSAMGVLGGDDKGAFNPKATIKRSEAAKIIAIFADYDKAAGSFYAAANKFTDVPANHWAVSYIAYANQTGIVSGVGNGKFNPDGTLTGVQFLKMALCTLGFDAAAEGYVGANWAVNVLDRAKALDLTAGIEGFDAGAAITREQAAQIMLNVLLTDVVEYGTSDLGLDVPALVNSYKALATSILETQQNVRKRITDIEFWETFFNFDTDELENTTTAIVDIIVKGAQTIGKLNLFTVTDNGAKDSGIPYFVKWANNNGITLLYIEGEDNMYRPQREWIIATDAQDADAKDLVYVDSPVKTYTSSIIMCDLAKDLGFGPTSTATLSFVYQNTLDAEEKPITFTFKHGSERADIEPNYVHKKSVPMYCDDDLYTPGVTIEVFQLGTYSFKIVSYYQYVGQVVDAAEAETDKYGHENKATVDIQVLSTKNDWGWKLILDSEQYPVNFTVENKDNLAVGDFVTFNLSAKSGAMINIAKAETFTGVYNRNKGGKMMIDGEQYTVSTVASDEVKKAVADNAGTRFRFGQKYTFVKDAQGNILHIDAFVDAYTLVTLDDYAVKPSKKRGVTTDTIYADVVSLTDGTLLEDIVLVPDEASDDDFDPSAWLDETGNIYGTYFIKEKSDGTYWVKAVGATEEQYVKDEITGAYYDTIPTRTLLEKKIHKTDTKFLVVGMDEDGNRTYTVADWTEAKGYTCDYITVLDGFERTTMIDGINNYNYKGDGVADYVVMWNATPVDSYFYALVMESKNVYGVQSLVYIDFEDGRSDMAMNDKDYTVSPGFAKVTTIGGKVMRVEGPEAVGDSFKYSEAKVIYTGGDLIVDGIYTELASEYSVKVIDIEDGTSTPSNLKKMASVETECIIAYNDDDEVTEFIFVPKK